MLRNVRLDRKSYVTLPIYARGVLISLTQFSTAKSSFPSFLASASSSLSSPSCASLSSLSTPSHNNHVHWYVIIHMSHIYMMGSNIFKQWASIETLCACIVANTAFFYTLVKDLQGRHSHSKSSSNHVVGGNFYLQSLPSSSGYPDGSERPKTADEGSRRGLQPIV